MAGKGQAARTERFGDFWGKPAFPEVSRVEKIADLLDKEITVLDVELVKGKLKGEDSEFMVVKASDAEGEFTFVNGGKILMERIMGAKEQKLLPLQGVISEVRSKSNPRFTYFVIE